MTQDLPSNPISCVPLEDYSNYKKMWTNASGYMFDMTCIWQIYVTEYALYAICHRKLYHSYLFSTHKPSSTTLVIIF